MSSKRILIFSLTYLPLVGGAELAVKEITDRLRDYHFDMITLRARPELPRFEAIGNIHVYRVGNGLSYIHKILFIPGAAWKAFSLHRKRPYDKFWAIMTNTLFPISLLRIFFGNKTPYVLTLQDGDPFERVFKRFRIRVFAPFLRYGFRHAAVIQVISNFLAEWPKRMGYKGRVAVIPNGVNVEKFKNPGKKIKSSDILLITTSRLTKKNGLEDVIDALTLLPKNVRFDILGEGELRPSLVKKVNDLGLRERVRFLGFVNPEDIPSLLHEADIFIRPSLSEGFGSSFVEAMAAGLPVIATPVGGIPDFLFDPDKNKRHPPTGFFVGVNDPQSIARQVKRIVEDPRATSTIVSNAKRMVKEKYDWDIIANEMKRLVFEPIS